MSISGRFSGLSNNLRTKVWAATNRAAAGKVELLKQRIATPVGTQFGGYEILAPIGAGGMGEVYRARDTKLKRDVAMKVLPEAFAKDPSRMLRFRREADVVAALNHPNIAKSTVSKIAR